MSTPAKTVFIFCVAIGSFIAGSWWNRSSGNSQNSAPRKILYYHDPMHPAYKSSKPGVAPDCGMQLEPVFADGRPADASANSSFEAPSAPGTVQTSSDKQQMIGVRVEEARMGSGPKSIRLLGRTVPDENRIYKVNATIDGWIRQIKPAATTGSLVHKDETLATYNAPEFLGPMQAYLYALGAFDRFQATGKETDAQIALTKANIQQAKNSLLVFGMSELQANEMAQTRQLTEDIRVVAPAGGFILVRNVSPGQRFEKGTEFFRIADLSHIWILADIFESDAADLRPGAVATVHYRGKSLRARMSDVLPQFDGATRTMKARLEIDNPGFLLRPDMFVDVELPVTAATGLAIPVDAVIDSGLKKTVYVDSGDGNFEPRAVETGWRSGDRVQITKGLEAGERIVVSGNFLLDSESRMKLTSIRATAPAPGKDPACGMDVDPAKASEKSELKGKTYYFCSKACKEKFDKNPEQYLGKQQVAQRAGPVHD